MEQQKQESTTKISYYHAVFGRPAKVKMFFMRMMLTLSYFFRVPIEVIVRRHMGEDYFNTLLTTLMGLAFLIFPYFVTTRYGHTNWELLLKNFATWYLYTGFFIYSAYQRIREIRSLPSIWEYKRYTMSEGLPYDPAELLKVNIPYPGFTNMSLYIEPGIFFIGGIILALFSQPVGYLFIICAIIYSLGYYASFELGRAFFKDKINNIVFNQELANRFFNDKATGRGVNFDIPIPNDPETRRTIYDGCINPDNVIDIDHEDVK